MNNKFEEPMINVYNFSEHDIATDASLSGYGNETNKPIPRTNQAFNGNYITVSGGLDENIPL